MSALAVRRQLAASSAWRSSADSILLRQSRFLHATSAHLLPRKRQFFSSNAALQLEASNAAAEGREATSSQVQKRKVVRSAGKRSLRRVAVEAQISRDDGIRQKDGAVPDTNSNRIITAYCVAEEFNMDTVVRILRSQGYPIDPHGTGFMDEQVVHTKGPNDGGDIFVFPSGTVVTWSLPEELAATLATQVLKPAALNLYNDHLEVEDLEYNEDPTRETSTIKGDVITLGTKRELEQSMYVTPLVSLSLLRHGYPQVD